MRRQRENKLLAYLEARGVLANGTPDDIAAAKRAYRKLYQQEYKANYRASHNEVRFTLASSVTRSIDESAEALGIDRSMYAKEATLSRLSDKGQVGDVRVNRELLQKVALIHSEIRHLCRQKPSGFLERRIVYDALEKRIDALEGALRESLRKNL